MKIAKKIDDHVESRRTEIYSQLDENIMIYRYQINEKNICLLSDHCRFLVKTIALFQTKVK